MIICCKGCADCCDSCCKGIEKCCGGCCNAINKFFSTPFSLCSFATFFVVVVPSVIGLISLASVKSYGNICEKNIPLHLIIVAIGHLVNFLYAVYLFCKFRKPYEPTTDASKQHSGNASGLYDAPRETNVCQRLTKILCYDFVTLFYMLALAFQFVWAIIGHSWLSAVSPVCQELLGSAFTWDYILIVIFWAFIGIGLLVGAVTLCIQACEEGSCTWTSVCASCIYCCTCGQCCEQTLKTKNQERVVGFY